MTDEESWRERARRFAASEIAPVAEAMDRTDRMPPAIRTGLAAEGFLGLGLPAAYGGRPASAVAIAAVLEEIAAASAAVATLLAVHLSVGTLPIVAWGTDAQKAEHLRPLAEGRHLAAFALTEPGAGSDTAALRTRYAAVDGGYRLDGAKMFITSAASADLLVVFATHDVRLGVRGISAFLLPRGTPGLSVAPPLAKHGLHGSETAEVVLDGVRLPASARLGPEGEGLRVALGALTAGRVGIAACALGVARAAFDATVAAARRAPSDARRAVVARSLVDVTAARALVARAAAERDAGRPFAEAASVAKLFASEAAVRVAHRGFDLADADAAPASSAAARLLRDARVFPIVEGTSEIQEQILGRGLLGRDG